MQCLIVNVFREQTCYICEDQGRESKAATGACMTCNKHGCRQAFHVTWWGIITLWLFSLPFFFPKPHLADGVIDFPFSLALSSLHRISINKIVRARDILMACLFPEFLVALCSRARSNKGCFIHLVSVMCLWRAASIRAVCYTQVFFFFSFLFL